MKLRFTRRAADDLQQIADYLKERDPQAAKRVRVAIIRSLKLLILFPRIGRRQSTANVRKIITRRYPYIVYYVIDVANQEIVILTIQHPARDRSYSDR